METKITSSTASTPARDTKAQHTYTAARPVADTVTPDDVYHAMLLPWMVQASLTSVPFVDWLSIRAVTSRSYQTFIELVYPRFCSYINSWLEDKMIASYMDTFRRQGHCIFGPVLLCLMHGQRDYTGWVAAMGPQVGAYGDGDYARMEHGGTYHQITFGHVLEYWPIKYHRYSATVDSYDFATYRAWFDGDRLYINDWTALTAPCILLTLNDAKRFNCLAGAVNGVFVPYPLSRRLETYRRHGFKVMVHPELFESVVVNLQ